MYAVQATKIEKNNGNTTGLWTLPMFYLNENVQGIVNDDHAIEIALQILRSGCGENSNIYFDLTVLKID